MPDTPWNLIFKSKNFNVEAAAEPLVDRDDGGHIIIDPIVPVRARQELSPQLAIELMRLTIVVGHSMTTVMKAHGVDIGRVNYQDNGNWSVFKPEGPKMHVHIYGRATNAKYQRYGQACSFPHKNEDPDFYKNFRALNPDDIKAIGDEVRRLHRDEKFADENWTLNS